MRPQVIRRAAAVAAFTAYWLLFLFGVIGPDRGDVAFLPREAYYALMIGLPCFLVGIALASWWAPAVGLLFVAMVPLPRHCVESRDGDFVSTGCSGVAASDLPLILALTTPCVLAGVVAAKLWKRRRPSPSGTRSPTAPARAG